MNVYLPSMSWYNNSARVGPLYGGTVAAPTWRRYMDQAVADLPPASFPAPDQDLIGQAPPPPRSDDNEDDSENGDPGSGDSGDTGDSGDSGDGGGDSGGDEGGPGNGDSNGNN
jgi:membrane peptidoglycan carboxypeptidase